MTNTDFFPILKKWIGSVEDKISLLNTKQLKKNTKQK